MVGQAVTMEQDLLHDWDDTPADEKKGDQDQDEYSYVYCKQYLWYSKTVHPQAKNLRK